MMYKSNEGMLIVTTKEDSFVMINLGKLNTKLSLDNCISPKK